MALYFKFISAKDYDSISMVDPFISVSELKREIFESKYKAKKDSNSNNGLCFGTDFDINVINPETNEEYVNDSILIPKNSKVLIRRVPGGRGGRHPIDVTPIVVGGENLPKNNKTEESDCSNRSTVTVLSKDSVWSGSSLSGFDFDTDFDAEFGGDVFAVKQNRGGDVACESGEEDEKGRIEELVNTPALEWQNSNGVGFGRGDKRVPHAEYVCRRCNVAGHFIQHCPTNGDPNYDLKRSTPSTGIPKSRLAAAVLLPDEAAFEKAMEGIPSIGRSKPVPQIPSELLCPLCKNVMNDAVISSKCCFRSFCYKCIRDHLLELKSVCVCGAINILADYLIPNLTLRDTINRYLESGIANSSSSENSNGNSVREAAPASGLTSKISSTTMSVVPAGEERKRLRAEVEDKEIVAKQMVEKASIRNAVDVSEVAVESTRVKGAVSDEGGTKKKKRKMAQVEYNESYTMPSGYYGYDPSWVGMNMGMEGYMPHNYDYNNGLGHYSAQYGSVMRQNHFYSYHIGPR